MSTEINIFEQASRLKLRFESEMGHLSVEQLWELPLKASSTSKASVRFNLNDLAKSVHRELKATEEEDFVDTASKPEDLNVLRLEILKHIIAIKQAEATAKAEAADRKRRKEILIEALARKQDERVGAMSEEEIRKEIEQLG